MKLLKEYLEEREGKQILWEDWGFATFKIEKDHIYIEDVYVQEKQRKGRKASFFVDLIAEIAEEKGLKKLITTVDLRANNPGLGMRAILGYGFEPYICENDLVYFIKEI